MSRLPVRVLIFCRVVDNFGDIGICWRLARQLAQEHGLDVTLMVDNPVAFARLEPSLDPAQAAQDLGPIHVQHWTESCRIPDPLPDLVIETFSCRLPEPLMAAMAQAPVPPRWLNLDHVSAEAWVDDSHGLISVHPSTGLKRRFLFPGFTLRSGGLLRERPLLADRDAFQSDEAARRRWWQQHVGAPWPAPDTLRVSLFAYPFAPVPALLEALARQDRPVCLLVPQDEDLPALTPPPGLHLVRYPFLRQPDFDRLLWCCDLNFVRGEDSFIRALWAGHPFIWQAYAQPENAHRDKLAAFLRLYTAEMPEKCAQTLEMAHGVWNLSPAAAPDGLALLLRTLPALRTAARQASDRLARQEDCTSRLLRLPTE